MKQLLVFILALSALSLAAQFTDITPDNLVGADFVGLFVEIEGNDLLVSAINGQVVSELQGAVHHYVYSGSEWQLNQRILPQLPEDQGSSRFGGAPAISGDWFMTSLSEAGTFESVVFFNRINDNWVRHSKITGNLPDIGFGWQMAIDGTTAVVGSIADLNATNVRTGSAYIYEYNAMSDSWEEVQVLIPNELEADYFFGSAIYLKDGLLAISARQDGVNGNKSGAVYVFEKQQGSWIKTSELRPSDADAGDLIGYRVDGDGDRLIISGYGADNETGSAYVYKKGTEWELEARLIAADLTSGDWFGSSIAIEGERALVGARNHDGLDGAVFVFEFENGEWSEKRKFSAPEGILEGRFGAGLDYQDNQLVVGAPWINDFEGGVFALDYRDLTSVEKLTIEEPIILYPNPTKNSLNLNLSEDQVIHLVIFNVLGEKVASYDYLGSAIDVSQLDPGSYMVKRKKGNEQVEIGSFIKI